MYTLSETKWIWRDGEFVAWRDANIHVLSHSVQFGSSVFEGIRCYATARGPAIFRLQDHLQRMIDSAKIYRMELAFTLDELVAACCELVERNELDSCYLRPMVIRGYGAAGMVLGATRFQHATQASTPFSSAPSPRYAPHGQHGR